MLFELLVISAILLAIYVSYRWATMYADFFDKIGITHSKPIFPFGDMFSFFLGRYNPIEFGRLMYNKYPDEDVVGVYDFRQPAFLLRNPELVKQMAVKYFDHFEDRQTFVDDTTDLLFGNSLLMLKGQKWRDMRATLSPAFTGSKMRLMFELVSECAQDVTNEMNQRSKGGEEIKFEMKDLYSRYACDVVASCAFGIKVNSLENENNYFYVGTKKILNFKGLAVFVRLLIVNKMPSLARALGIQFFSTSITMPFRSMILDNMDIRKEKNIYRPDMINMLMQVRQGNYEKINTRNTEGVEGIATVEESDIGKMTVHRKWTDDELAAQCFVFFLAGFDSASSLLVFTSYELAIDPDVQQKLYNAIVETNEKLAGKPITYDELQKIAYLDQVVSEGLRKWIPFPTIDRVCVKDYTYDDGKLKFDVKKGRSILIPVSGFHYDPKYFPDPEKFDPERFSPENKYSIVPGTYIPFGIGPRNCIGSRFALMEVKVLLYYLLLNYSIEPTSETQIPVKLAKAPFGLNTENGMKLVFKPRAKRFD